MLSRCLRCTTAALSRRDLDPRRLQMHRLPLQCGSVMRRCDLEWTLAQSHLAHLRTLGAHTARCVYNAGTWGNDASCSMQTMIAHNSHALMFASDI